jgi:hypothetical protein
VNLFVFFLFVLLLASPTFIGHVTDTAGKPVAGATVKALSEGGGAVATTTDNAGRFRLEVSGRFKLEISQPGYRTLQSKPIQLSGEGVYSFAKPISLLPGSPEPIEIVDLQVETSDEAPDREEPGAKEGLPKADRIFGLRGGVNVTGIAEGSGQQWVAASGNVFNSSSSSSKSAGAGPWDFSAERAGSGQTEEVLPAGQAQLHGNAHYFGRNEMFNARNFFDPANAPIPPFKYHLFGGDLGGPIHKETYFYVQYWGLRIRQSVTRAATTPDPAWLNGDFSSLPANALLDPETGLFFKDNQIPKDRFKGLAFASLYPAPNVPGVTIQNYRAVGELSTAADSFGNRFDRRWTIADEGSLEYQFYRDTTDDPFNLLNGITNLPFFGDRDALRTHSLRIQNTHVFSPTVIQQIRVRASRLEQPRTLLPSPTGPLPAILVADFSNIGHAANFPQNRRDESVEISSDISWQHRSSTTKFGASVGYFPLHASLDLYKRGQFQFTDGIYSGNAFANLLLGVPTNALRLDGDTTRNFRTWIAGVYLQHEWQPIRRAAISFGIRYDLQTPYRERDGLAANFNPATDQMEQSAGGLYRPDRNNFAPRVGITWQAPGKIVSRASYGIFYDTLLVGDSLFLLGLNPPFVRFDVVNNGPVAPAFDLTTAFSNLTASTPPSVFSASRNLSHPYLQRWTLSLSKDVGRDLVLETAYSGEKGTHLRRQVNLNQPPAGPVDTLDDRRPFPGFRNIFQFETSASSIAHSLEARVTRRTQSGFGFTASYRLSKTIDDATLISILPQDSHNLRAERGLSDFDMRHRLSASGNYSFPQSTLLRGWQILATSSFQSGTPLSAVLGADDAGTGSPIVNRPDLIGNPNVSHPTPQRFFNPQAFQAPPAGRFGRSGRNVITGPGFQTVDLSLTRAFRMSDFTRLQFRTDAYNAFNHVNFVAPPSMQNFADAPDFGALYVARSPRILQFGLKFLW